MAAHLAHHHVGAGDVRATALVECQERNLAGAQCAGTVVDDAAGLRIHLAREEGRDAGQEYSAYASDEAAPQEFSASLRPPVTAVPTVFLDAFRELGAAQVRCAALVCVLTHRSYLVAN